MTTTPADPVTTTTDEVDVILRFLSAAENRIAAFPGRLPLNALPARAAINWLRALATAELRMDGSVAP